jgi:hypothetical protein
MTISTVSSPDTNSSVYIPMLFTMSSGRYNASPSSVNPTSVTDSSGDALFTKVAHGLLTGDIVLNASFATSTTYNGYFSVSKIGADTFKLLDVDGDELAYDTNDVSGTYTLDNHNRNFQLKCEIKESLGSTILNTKRINVNSSAQFVLDVANVLKTYLKKDKTGHIANVGSHTVDDADNSYLEYEVDFTEEIDGLSGAKVSLDTSTVSSLYGFLIVLQYTDTQNIDKYVMEIDGIPPAVLSDFLTDNKSMFFSATSYGFLHFITDAAAAVLITYQAYNNASLLGSGNLIASPYYTGIRGFGRINFATIIAAYATANKVTLRVEDGGGEIYSETITFNLKTVNSTTKEIYWLNERGGVDMFFFTGKHIKFNSVEKQAIEMQLQSGYTYLDRGKKVISQQLENGWEFIADNITQTLYDWLVEILNSPEVFIKETISGTDYLIPLIVTTESVELQLRETRLFKFTALYSNRQKAI